MTCPSCNNTTSHVRVVIDHSGCPNCMGFSETGGSSTHKVLTRNSDRVLEQQIQHEGDMIAPYIVDKSTNQVIVNQDFIDMYPNQAADTYTQDELRLSGNENLKKIDSNDKGDGIEFKGSQEDAIEGIVSDSQ